MAARFPFARGTVDSLVAWRDQVDLRELLGAATALLGENQYAVRVHAVCGPHVLTLDGPDSSRRLATLNDQATTGPQPKDFDLDVIPVMLGATAASEIHLALIVNVPPAAPDWPATPHAAAPPPSAFTGAGTWENLRIIAHKLSDDDVALAAAAVALGAWHADNAYCGRCGNASTPSAAGWTRTCSTCGHVEYPRQDPAVIVTVVDDRDRLLLAHNTMWRPRFMSLPAGFVDAGEDPERTVVRELMEEVGLKVHQVQANGSQPWPFPRSLMLGYTARLHPDSAPEPTPDMDEIDLAAFFTRDEYVDAVVGGRIEAPGPTTIARRLIEEWLGHPLTQLWEDDGMIRPW